MAKEYIEREMAIETLYYNTDETCSAVVPDFEAIPAADVAPVVHGHFIHDGQRFAGGVDWWHCGSCGALASGIETRFNYCPWCGAKMDGGAENG